MGERDRRTYLGGPDVAALAGVSPFLTPIEVFRQKTGMDAPIEPTERMRLGLLLEQAIADAYCAEAGVKVRKTGWVGHPDYAFMGGHPDRVVVGQPGLLEAKASATTRGYSDEDVPPHVRVQTVWYLGLTGRAWCDVALLAHMGLRIVRVEHDPDLYDALVELAVRFWTEHVLANVEPSPDGSEAYRRHLAERFPQSAEIQLIATPEQALLIEELRVADEAHKAAKRHVDELENRIRAAMGEAAELVSPDGRITYRTEKPRVRWQEVAEAIAIEWKPLEAALLIADYSARDTAGRNGPRVLRKNFPKTGEEGVAAA